MNLTLLNLAAPTLVFAIFAAIIALILLVAVVWKDVLRRKIRRYNFKKVDLDVKAGELARINLDKAGLSNVEVVKGLGNGFKKRSNKITLKAKVFERNTVSAIAIAMQQVSKAIHFNTNPKKYKGKMFLRDMFEVFTVVFSVGAIIMLIVELTSDSNPIVALILLLIGIVFYIFSFIWSIKLLKQQKEINTIAMGIIGNMGVFSDEELTKIEGIYKAFNAQYIIKAVLSIVYLVQFIFRAVVLILKIMDKK